MATQLETISNNIVNAEKLLREEIIPKAEPFLTQGNDLELLKEYGSKLEGLAAQITESPTFSILFLGDTQNGKSTLINVLMGAKILPEGNVGRCSTAIVRCRYKDQDETSVTFKYVTENQFSEDFKAQMDTAERALENEDDVTKQKRIVTSSLERFTDLSGINVKGLQPSEIIDRCKREYLNFQEHKLLGERKPFAIKSVSLMYPTEDQFTADFEVKLDHANALMNANDPNNSIEQVNSLLRPFIELFDIDTANFEASEIIDCCMDRYYDFLERNENLWKAEADKRREIENEIKENLAANGRKSFIIQECLIEGRFPNWHPSMELVDMPGTNAANSWDEQVTARMQTEIDGLAIVTKETQITQSLMDWIEQAGILREIAGSSERNQTRVFLIKTKLDNLDGSWPLIQEKCSEIKLYFKKQLQCLIDACFSAKNELDVLRHFMGQLPIHFVSSKAFHDLNFGVFNMNPENTGIPGLQQDFYDKTEKFVHSHYLRRLELEFQKEVDQMVQFFRDKRVGIEQGMVQKGKAIHDAKQFIGERLPKEVAKAREFFEGQIADLKDNFEQKIESLLNDIVNNYRQQACLKLHDWALSIKYNSMSAIARGKGCHTIKGNQIRLIDINGTLADFCLIALNSAWIDYRNDIKKLSFDDLRIQFIPNLESILAQAKGIDDPKKISLIENTYGQAVYEVRNELEIQSEKYLTETEEFDAIRPALIKSIRKFLMPTYENIKSESGTGCTIRMHRYLKYGVLDSIQKIRSIVRNQVRHNWQGLTNSVEERLEEFFDLIENNISEQSERLSESAQTPPNKQVKLLDHFKEMENLAEELVPKRS